MSLKFNPFTGSFDYVRDVTAPIILSGDSIGLDYNTTNLKITASQLNTIQDIATTSSPTFANLTLGNGTADTQINFDATNDGTAKWDTSDKCLFLLSNGATQLLSSLFYEAGCSIVTNSGTGDRYALQSWVVPSGAATAIGGYWGGVQEPATGFSVGEMYGGTFYNELYGTNARTVNSLVGNYIANANFGSSLSCTDVKGLYINATEGGGSYSAITNMYGLQIGTPDYVGTATNYYGLRIESETQATNDYGIWLGGALALHLRAATAAIWSSAANTLDLTANTTMNFKIGANPANGTAGTIYGKLTATGLGLLMGSASPTNALSLSGDAARTIWMERHTTSNTAGNILTVQAGGATSGATNKTGGKLVLSSGIATGSQTSSVEIWTAASGASGTTDRTPSVKLAIAGSGAQTLTQSGSITGITQNLANTSTSTAQDTKGSYWGLSHTGMVDSSITGLLMQLTGTVGAADTGNTTVNGFSFEIFAGTVGATAVAPIAIEAVGGYIGFTAKGTADSATLYRGDFQAASATGGTVNNVYIFRSSYSQPNEVTVGSYHHFYATSYSPGVGSGAVTNQYGLYIEELTKASNNYAIWISASNGIHFRQAGEKVYSSAADTLDLDSVTTINHRIGGTVKLALASSTLTFSDAVNIVTNGTTGTKIGTATSQKIALWNATPIVQPTTAIAAATRVGGGGATITDTDTFDGYTIAQVVKALRNFGQLA